MHDNLRLCDPSQHAEVTSQLRQLVEASILHACAGSCHCMPMKQTLLLLQRNVQTAARIEAHLGSLPGWILHVAWALLCP